jgi:hypothetical protein
MLGCYPSSYRQCCFQHHFRYHDAIHSSSNAHLISITALKESSALRSFWAWCLCRKSPSIFFAFFRIPLTLNPRSFAQHSTNTTPSLNPSAPSGPSGTSAKRALPSWSPTSPTAGRSSAASSTSAPSPALQTTPRRSTTGAN